MTYKRPWTLEVIAWIHGMLLFACLYPFLASVFSCQGMQFFRVALSGLLLIIPTLLSRILLSKIRNFVLYMLAGILISSAVGILVLLCAGAGTAPGWVSFAMAIFFGIVIFSVHAFAKAKYGRVKEEFHMLYGEERKFELQEKDIENFLRNPHFAHLVWVSLWYVLAMFLRFTTCLYVIFAMILVDVFLLIIYRYVEALYQYVLQNQKTANLPTNTMHQIHRISGVVGALILALFLLPSVLYGREFQPDLTTDQPIFTFDEEQERIIQEQLTGADVSNQLAELDTLPDKPTPKWLLAVCKAVAYIVLAGIVILVIIQIFRNVRRLGKEFAVEQNDEVVFLKDGEQETKLRLLRKKHSEGRMSANQQIRRRYRKTIRKAMKGHPSRWATPTEIEREAALEDCAAMQILHECYEKARYSEEGCGAEDLRKL